MLRVSGATAGALAVCVVIGRTQAGSIATGVRAAATGPAGGAFVFAPQAGRVGAGAATDGSAHENTENGAPAMRAEAGMHLPLVTRSEKQLRRRYEV